MHHIFISTSFVLDLTKLSSLWGVYLVNTSMKDVNKLLSNVNIRKRYRISPHCFQNTCQSVKIKRASRLRGGMRAHRPQIFSVVLNPPVTFPNLKNEPQTAVS